MGDRAVKAAEGKVARISRLSTKEVKIDFDTGEFLLLIPNLSRIGQVKGVLEIYLKQNGQIQANYIVRPDLSAVLYRHHTDYSTESLENAVRKYLDRARTFELEPGPDREYIRSVLGSFSF